MIRPLCFPGKRLRFPVNRKGGPHSLSERFGEDKNLAVAGNRHTIPRSPALSLYSGSNTDIIQIYTLATPFVKPHNQIALSCVLTNTIHLNELPLTNITALYNSPIVNSESCLNVLGVRKATALSSNLCMLSKRDLKKSCPMPPHILVDFVVLPPGHDRSVTDF